ncbi:MAG: lysylphosphatidylglycerol synthase domain-containing protein, partial [Lachnospiraceae bacterium]|nr:lysylphosphatidylglycerol synthase domain-containing protein [Lachnospiraceae bacterium]
MSTKNKKSKPFIVLIAFTLLAVILYFMFRDSWRDILEQIKQAKKSYLLLLLLFGNCYVIMDGVIYWFILKRSGETCSLLESIRMAYLGIFLGISTMGTGTKPGQIYYLYQRGCDPGKSFGLLTYSYVIHKLVIILYAGFMLLFYHSFIQDIYAEGTSYLYAGAIFGGVIICVLILMCVSEHFHRLILFPFKKWIKKPAWREKIAYFEEQLIDLRTVCHAIFRDKWSVLLPVLFMAVKLTFWYVLPVIVCYALNLPALPCSFWEMLTTAAVMQLIIGVIPSASGLGSTEIVFLLLFGQILG